MGRYDRNSGKSSTKSLVIPIFISMMVGIVGTYFLMTQIKNNTVAENAIVESVKNEIADLENRVKEQQVIVEEKPTALPVETQIISIPTGQNILPDLLSSDETVQQAIFKLSPGLAAWFTTDQLIRKVVLIANDFAQAIRVSKHMSFLRLAEPFAVEQDGNELYIAPKNYQRFSTFVQAIQAVDAKSFVGFYQKFRPLTLQVFAELSYPKDISLESIIKKAAGEIISAPIVKERIPLIRPSIYYRFADPNMEALNGVQKQMIRLGPENTLILQNKCRELLVALGKADIK